jgi:3-deoxy-manno-octulosonate cytidylyltransferase (CMP-KDO synthetase)
MTARHAIRTDEIVGCIPARWGSTRFPGKLLTPIAGRPLLEWVIRGCRKSRKVGRWIVATDDQRIAALAEQCDTEAVMTPARLRSGSDRVAHVVRRLKARWILNWQGDEWLPDGRPIDRLVDVLAKQPQLRVATLARPFDPKETSNPNRVKVVLSCSGRALYFSRASIPSKIYGTAPTLLHLGAYLFERKTLLQFTRLVRTPLERAESLEQLRLLEHDIPIGVGICKVHTWGVDTPADARKLTSYLRKRQK